ncbi:hypothetical protein M409DRAFT_22804 [Zasmidium cellare ATCC 36951]|uniref:2EXR domain-containing protein n=1 Tax=Zasmidium cellare ATCC 36951 TaxID=1080233 RepID=A0A6A6CKR1_ZASCE|nr:uncharacterized protein M409DRAFT_22804 [Zasmidium cellare ATCC 36951]KAF2166750.1 hypothetical protein M409DRAFT_22804 [Zasmidium cellare ATCC 36951]
MAAPCPLFEKLPPELRNEIYRLTFTVEDEGKDIRLRDAAPPEKAILLTCKQAHTEAAKLHKIMYRDYWRKTTFSVQQHRHPRLVLTRRILEDHVEIHRPVDVNHIEHLTLTLKYAHATERLHLEDSRGIWRFAREGFWDRYVAI